MLKSDICFVGLENAPLLLPELSHIRTGGAQVQQVSLARALAKAGYHVSMVVADYGQDDYVEVENISLYRAYKLNSGFPLLRFFHPRITSLWAALKKANARVNYTSCAGSQVGVLAAYCYFSKSRMIYRVASDTDCDPNAVRIPNMRDRWLYLLGLKAAHSRFAQTLDQKRLLQKTLLLDSVVLPPITGFEVKANLPYEQRDIDVLWVGNIRALKRPFEALSLAENFPKLSLHILGGEQPREHDLFRSVEQKSRELPNVHFHGFRPYSEVAGYFQRAKLLVSTSSVEGFPNTYLQAWANGAPVLAYLDPENMIENNALGSVVGSLEQLKMEVLDFMTNQERWESASRRCRAFYSDRFSPEKAVEQYIEEIFSGQ
jgi:glycosyltransferase involved in cell wall biosynthesis